MVDVTRADQGEPWVALTFDLAESLDDLLVIADRVVLGEDDLHDLEYHLVRVRRLHNYHEFKLDGEAR
jgi:hypothetical protein